MSDLLGCFINDPSGMTLVCVLRGVSITHTPARPGFCQVVQGLAGVLGEGLSVWRGVSEKAVTLSAAGPVTLVMPLSSTMLLNLVAVELDFTTYGLSALKSKQFHEANEPHHLQPLFRCRWRVTRVERTQ